MNRIQLTCVWFTCCAPLVQAKTVEIEGPLIAPWIHGQLCIRYSVGQDREVCQLLGAGQKFVFTLPDTVRRIHISRILDKNCPRSHAVKACQAGHGSFTVKDQHTVLKLTQHGRRIRRFFVVTGPAVEPNNAYRSSGYYTLPGWWLDETGAVNWKQY